VKLVSVDALPAQLEYLSSGHVQVLLAQDCFGWGYKSVELLLAKALDGAEPEGGPLLVDPLRRITRGEVEAVAAQWRVWLGER
jgi:ribose transport system substrate-binding protein